MQNEFYVYQRKVQISKQRKEIYLVGTHHLSKQSADDVRQIIQKVKPDVVVIELCENRIGFLFHNPQDKRPQFLWNRPFISVISLFMNHVGKRLNVSYGGEFRAAFEEAQKLNIPVILGDRPMEVTSKRFYRMIPPREFLQHISHAWKSLSRFMKNASKTDTTEFIMEELQPPTKDLGSLNPLIHEKLNQCPTLKKVLVDERDQYMASVLRDSPGHRIVGVFGLGHIDGIAQHLKDDDVDGKALRKQLTTIPPHTFYSSIFYPLSAMGLIICTVTIPVLGIRYSWKLCRWILTHRYRLFRQK